jgi:hypothetical protein
LSGARWRARFHDTNRQPLLSSPELPQLGRVPTGSTANCSTPCAAPSAAGAQDVVDLLSADRVPGVPCDPDTLSVPTSLAERDVTEATHWLRARGPAGELLLSPREPDLAR